MNPQPMNPLPLNKRNERWMQLCIDCLNCLKGEIEAYLAGEPCPPWMDGYLKRVMGWYSLCKPPNLSLVSEFDLLRCIPLVDTVAPDDDDELYDPAKDITAPIAREIADLNKLAADRILKEKDRILKEKKEQQAAKRRLKRKAPTDTDAELYKDPGKVFAKILEQHVSKKVN